MKSFYITTSAVLTAALCAAASFAQAQEVEKDFHLQYSSEVLAQRSDVTATHADFDAYLRDRVPPDKWEAILASPDRISEVINNIMLTQALADSAWNDEELVDESFTALLYRRVALELAARYRERYLDRNELEDYESAARELYMTEGDKFMSTATIDIDHILIAGGDAASEAELMREVLQAYDRISEGEDFSSVAREVSDEPNVDDNSGRMTEINPEELVRPLANAIKEVPQGELAPPVRTQYGWHIARVVRENPAEELSWEEAKPQAVEQARANHRQMLWERHLKQLQDSPTELTEGAVSDLLERHGVEGLEGSLDENLGQPDTQN